MKKLAAGVIALFLIFTWSGRESQARNVGVIMEVSKIVEIATREGRIPVGASLMFGKDAAPPGSESVRTVEVTGKAYKNQVQPGYATTGLLTDEEACERAAVEAVARLAAQMNEADRVIGNITSKWQGGAEYSSSSRIECRAGSASVGVGLRGKLYPSR